MRDLVIIGGGKAAKVIASILMEMSSPRPALHGYTDVKKSDFFDDQLFLGPDTVIPNYYGSHSFCISLGKPELRKKLYDEYVAGKDCQLSTIISPQALVSSCACIMAGTIIGTASIVYFRATIGRNCWIGINSAINHDCNIDDHCLISSGVSLAGSVTIGEATLVGVGATVAPDITIGSNCVIASGAAVMKDVPDNTLVLGNPARAVKAVQRQEQG